MKLTKKSGSVGLILVGLLVILGLPAWQVWPYFAPSGSSLRLEVVGTSAVVRFNLLDKDKISLTSLSKKLNLTWTGQDVAVSLDATTSAKLRSVAPLNLGLSAVSEREVVLNGSVLGLPLGAIGTTSEGEEFFPPSTALVLRARHLQTSYQLPGQETFKYVAARGALGVSPTDTGLGIIFVIKVKDEPGLKSQLASLKNLPVNTGPGYSGVEGVAAGFSESSIAGVTTYTLSQPGLAYQPTFGILRGYLVVGSSPEVWKSAQLALSTGGNITTNPRYAQAKLSEPSFSNGSLYLDLKALAVRGTKTVSDAAPLFKLDLAGEFLNSGLAGDHLVSLSAQWLGLVEQSPARVVVRIRGD